MVEKGGLAVTLHTPVPRQPSGVQSTMSYPVGAYPCVQLPGHPYIYNEGNWRGPGAWGPRAPKEASVANATRCVEYGRERSLLILVSPVLLHGRPGPC